MTVLADIRTMVRRELRDEKSFSVEKCESGWVAKTNVTVTHDTTYYKEGSKSVKIAIADAFTTGIAAYKDLTEVDLSKYGKIVLWVRPSIATIAAGDLEIHFCGASGGISGFESLKIPAMGAANLWYRVPISFTDATLYTNVVSVVLNVVTDRGACDIYLDDICVEPSTYRWTDGELDDHIGRALKEFSNELPRKRITVLRSAKTCHDVDDEDNKETLSAPSGQTEVNAFLNSIKAKANTHMASTTYHKAADTTNTIAATDATTLATSKTLAVAIKNSLNGHRTQSGVHYTDDETNQLTFQDPYDLDDVEDACSDILTEYNDHLDEDGTGAEVDISSLTNRISTNAVEYPTGQNPPSYVDYEVHDDTLTLLSDYLPSENDEDIKVYWDSLHTLDTTTSTLEAHHEQVLALGAAAYALLEYGAYTINRINIADVSYFRALGNEKLMQFRSVLMLYRRGEPGKSQKVSTWSYRVS